MTRASVALSGVLNHPCPHFWRGCHGPTLGPPPARRRCARLPRPPRSTPSGVGCAARGLTARGGLKEPPIREGHPRRTPPAEGASAGSGEPSAPPASGGSLLETPPPRSDRARRAHRLLRALRRGLGSRAHRRRAGGGPKVSPRHPPQKCGAPRPPPRAKSDFVEYE
jgi:hypothetical protein